MKRILGGLAVVMAVGLAVGIGAGAILGLSLGLGWLVARVAPIDLFQGAILGLLSLMSATLIAWRILAAAAAQLAGRSGRRATSEQASPQATPREGAVGLDAEEEGAEAELQRRRGRGFDA